LQAEVDPSAADIDQIMTTAKRPGIYATADSIVAFEHQNRAAMIGQIPRGRDAGEARSNDENINLIAHHGRQHTSRAAQASSAAGRIGGALFGATTTAAELQGQRALDVSRRREASER
jgi:hypothetical protein